MAMTDTAIIPEWTRGDRLEKARELAGLTQEEMAERLDVKRTTLSAWERDDSQPRDVDWVMTRYSEETGVDLAWLYGFRTGSFLQVLTNPDAIQSELPFERHLEPVP